MKVEVVCSMNLWTRKNNRLEVLLILALFSALANYGALAAKPNSKVKKSSIQSPKPITPKNKRKKKTWQKNFSS